VNAGPVIDVLQKSPPASQQTKWTWRHARRDRELT